ncbi:helix-turn-helix transcriptional regulator [Streptomyces kunmingensis]|uniref:Helix-turn-helix transcriptional regulator n=1 Tax=Streptomyces kunmingensis TaxID=68225 RepID=A0ABU6CEH6_9ACTN|nr:helix-turn-helix transcriptional regulator [Streptomyces kunmingensis]MEB3963012.1 helix-turn-helix transcriptional regulator [Streptomyces kunmingensis]
MEPEYPLGAFLRSRRLAYQPDLRGTGARLRRTQGLRREEVASLAGVSADYYARLEQGRKRFPSEAVLNAIATALDLSVSERIHLVNLTHLSPHCTPPTTSARPGLLRLMESVREAPAVIHGRGMDVLAANAAARVVITDFYALPARERNTAHWFFLNEESRNWLDWSGNARDIVGALRFDAGLYPSDRRLQKLICELSQRSPVFAKLWAEHPVELDVHPRRAIRHPVAGVLEFEVEEVTPRGDWGQTLDIFMPKAGSYTRQAVDRLLGNWEDRARLSSTDAGRAATA